MTTRTELRQHFRQLRQQVPSEIRKLASQQIIQQIQSAKLLGSFQHFASYLSHDGEVDTLPLISYLWQQNKTCYLPTVAKLEDRFMAFVSYHSGDTLQKNRYLIEEPILINHKIISPEKIDVVFLPLVAFDLTGNRLGMGGGYYDRTFAFTQVENQDKKPLLIGISYEIQRADTLPINDWDVKLDGVITEQNFYWFNNTCNIG